MDENGCLVQMICPFQLGDFWVNQPVEFQGVHCRYLWPTSGVKSQTVPLYKKLDGDDRGYNPCTKYHGHPSTIVRISYSKHSQLLTWVSPTFYETTGSQKIGDAEIRAGNPDE